jgi:hypothetical protein
MLPPKRRPRSHSPRLPPKLGFQCDGNKRAGEGQGYEGVTHNPEIGFFAYFVNTLLHLQFSPCKIRAGPIRAQIHANAVDSLRLSR